MPNKTTKSLKITQIKSVIGHNSKTKRTMAALGLRKMHQTVMHADTPQIQGMINAVSFLLKVEKS
ncbi:MAG: 50S ribosomal protein L30 [Candidatus Marinimicrobia bacterium]|jgi:large subunit ribosomal protein L30|nr:50S ribosomal protein L30 [Candidatus Neomarinimicrobiota bacterium]MDP6396188.1 50S ribosomal protein L30 [Candidatus Neomarinimicrobiota bacterium]MDP6568983.1 50S ribosomal protein L30 [Candidatus Neomarinimicrobiota bacterium]MDP7026696.1 50S ribosomal protein L30 [Candidatus Neomarinimicrobiota bacterium]MDP7558118.1 50S ribosomal protein L30 [Candidatus Neomarinimicrobiota bacterium]|tara:strand:+ start:2493 stop:2687 length:195 start_codon:yes stop_codon:yes gene_type:complete